MERKQEISLEKDDAMTKEERQRREGRRMRAEGPACRLAQGNALGICAPTTLRPEWATETFKI